MNESPKNTQRISHKIRVLTYFFPTEKVDTDLASSVCPDPDAVLLQLLHLRVSHPAAHVHEGSAQVRHRGERFPQLDPLHPLLAVYCAVRRGKR